MAAFWLYPHRRRPGFEGLSDTEVAIVASAFRRGQPVTTELSPALIALGGIMRRNLRSMWRVAVLAVGFAIGGTVLLEGHAAHAEIRGSILIAMAFAWIAMAAWRLQQRPGQIRKAERHARASLSAQKISDWHR
jgi:hypothetical protein